MLAAASRGGGYYGNTGKPTASHRNETFSHILDQLIGDFVCKPQASKAYFGIFAECCGLELPFFTLCVHNACIDRPSRTLQFNWPLKRNRCHRYFNKIWSDFHLHVVWGYVERRTEK